jgi:hypothetical protein
MILRENVQDPSTNGHSVDSWTESPSKFIIDRFKFIVAVSQSDGSPTTTGSTVGSSIVIIGSTGAGVFVLGAVAVVAIIKRRRTAKLPDSALKFPQGTDEDTNNDSGQN